MNERTTKTIKTLVIILFIMVGIILSFAYIGAFYGLKEAVALKVWIETYYPTLMTGSTFAGLLAGIRILMLIKTRSDLSLADILDIKLDIGKSKKDVECATTIMGETINKLEKTVDRLETANSELKQELECIKKNQAEEKEMIKLMTDVMLVYVFKNGSDKTIKELKLAYEESELLKNVRLMKEVASNNELKPKEQIKVEELIATSTQVIADAKKRVRL